MDIVEKIQALKEEKNAIVLAHYYVPNEVQEIADYIGDSFALAKIAKKTDADIIVFAGVKFMGESAKILNPEKKVLAPDACADCAMAHMASIEKVKVMREKYDDLAVVCYINSTAELKTVSDVCVTSSNAVKIVENLPQQNIYFIPDQNLGSYVKSVVKNKNIILNDGYCPVHHQMLKDNVLEAKKEHPEALVLVHPECKKEVLELADYVGSTSGIIDFATKSEKDSFIIGTELGVFYELQKQNPNKHFYPLLKSMICEDMKMITLEKIYTCLKNETNEVFVEEETKQKALNALNQMLEMAK